MEIPVIKIGNSRGIRLSKILIERYKFTEMIEIVLGKDGILLKPVVKKEYVPREGWADRFKQMHEEGDDELLIPDVFEDEKFEEWE